jgi:hypothetical protein
LRDFSATPTSAQTCMAVDGGTGWRRNGRASPPPKSIKNILKTNI